MRAQWNTGRMYQKDGQQIVAETVLNGEHLGILFNDLSRGIGGFIPLADGGFIRDEMRLRDLAMNNYDLGNYSMDSRALSLKWED